LIHNNYVVQRNYSTVIVKQIDL